MVENFCLKIVFRVMEEDGDSYNGVWPYINMLHFSFICLLFCLSFLVILGLATKKQERKK